MMAQISDSAVLLEISVCALREPSARKLSNGLVFVSDFFIKSCLVTRL